MTREGVRPQDRMVVLTIGHSTRPLALFIELLKAHRVEKVVDVRTVPRSRHNPQFNRETLPQELAAAGIGYVHVPALGGLRRPRADSVNLGWRNAGFRGFADYLQTPEFQENLELLLEMAKPGRVALMCAEAAPWRCHRSLIADALTVLGVRVEHILSLTRTQAHRLTPFARVEGTNLTYPGRPSPDNFLPGGGRLDRMGRTPGRGAQARGKESWFKMADPEPKGSRDQTYFGYRPVAAAEKARLVRNHFNTVAARYDLMNTLLSFGLHHLWKRTAIKMLALQPGERVLDVCGGTADLALLAARAVGPAGRVVVYDINRAMLAAGGPKVAAMHLEERIAFVQGDAECLACPDSSFDAAMVGFGIRNLTHPEAGFKEMHRVLKPGGRLMCLEFSQPVSPWFRWLYDCYSFAVMPLAGRLVVGSWQAYRYLPESIRMFATPGELAVALAGLGFTRVRYRRLTNGIAGVHVGVRA